ncbi:GFA family protein [Thalassococcus sp. CAU 1522]|uniref:GFA family protein n=1 Tax=Thalassococcus arenae TaxID=2851652 RepID=A0ABS6N825_9RHOB|nr:GFA family protein [Thalassococcus arenae]MBV2360169.1 GFA family protein [Thalassococcus arenae]
MKGSCACGEIGFAVSGKARSASICHCRQCRKMSGHAWASAQVQRPDLQIEGPVLWIALSDRARRGICPECGSFLFWQGTGETAISFALGAIDGPTSLTIEKHLFSDEKADYESVSDGSPQWV